MCTYRLKTRKKYNKKFRNVIVYTVSKVIWLDCNNEKLRLTLQRSEVNNDCSMWWLYSRYISVWNLKFILLMVYQKLNQTGKTERRLGRCMVKTDWQYHLRFKVACYLGKKSCCNKVGSCGKKNGLQETNLK